MLNNGIYMNTLLSILFGMSLFLRHGNIRMRTMHLEKLLGMTYA